ncbi:MAG: hypothetical protein ACK55O_01455 [Phycisphaerales bacterium]|jgi:hypothetical protein|nr:hypothetical protein [Phycisphaeraceae bacterium]
MPSSADRRGATAGVVCADGQNSGGGIEGVAPAAAARSPRRAPPTERTGSVAKAQVWHEVLGIIGIVLGSVGVLMALWQLVWPGIAALIGGPFAAAMRMPEGSTLPTHNMIYGVVKLAIEAALIVLCAMLVRRHRASVWGLRIWAIAEIIVLPYKLCVTAWSMEAGFEQQAAGPRAGGPAPEIIEQLSLVMGVGFSALWTLALPIFLLWWFGRRTIIASAARWPGAARPGATRPGAPREGA